MPHKHKRRKTASEEALFDLPPTKRAAPLPVGANAVLAKTRSKKRSKGEYGEDDTPKSFARLLEFHRTGKRLPRGLDDGTAKAISKKRKRGNQVDENSMDTESRSNDNTPSEARSGTIADGEENKTSSLKILPGERLGDFARRVNQALPIAGLSRKGKKIEGMKERRTKHEKRLRRLQQGWREDEERIREKEEEAREIAEEEWEEKIAGMDGDARELLINMSKPGGGVRKRKNKSKMLGEVDEKEDDPWEILKTKRAQPKGLNDVVQAPPKLDTLPKELFKSARVADVPRGSGSLRKREELRDTRNEIIKRYRSIMAEKKRSGE